MSKYQIQLFTHKIIRIYSTLIAGLSEDGDDLITMLFFAG